MYRVVWNLAGLLALMSTSALAQTNVCPTPHQQEVFCAGSGGCSGSVTHYYCSGYGTGSTCGGPCRGTVIKCCGNVVGYNTVQCDGTTCAGCEPNPSKSTIAAIQTVKSDETGRQRRASIDRPVARTNSSNESKDASTSGERR